jgi:hypothetical protein
LSARPARFFARFNAHEIGFTEGYPLLKIGENMQERGSMHAAQYTTTPSLPIGARLDGASAGTGLSLGVTFLPQKQQSPELPHASYG